MLTDATRHEFERLVRMGRETFGPPSPRQMLVARTIDPSAWSANAQEHVDWAIRYGRTGRSENIGAQFLILRRLALMQATELLRRLDRQAGGLRELPTLDAVALSSDLGGDAMNLRMADPRCGVSHHAARAVMFLKQLDGIPAPVARMAKDGSVTLEWSEGDRCATISVDTQGAMELSLSAPDAPAVEINPMTWDETPWRLVTAATDWVHYDGPLPGLASQAVGDSVTG